MQSIKEFLNNPETKIMRNHSMGQNMSIDFFRDPLRSVTYEPSVFYAPADGIVLYAMPEVKPDDFLEIKGKEFTLKDMLHDPKYNEKSLVIGIFMTTYSVHINRVPANSYFIDERFTNFIYTHNISMLMAENDLLKDFGYNKNSLAYLTSNERRVSVFYCPAIRGRYYIVQVGDKDIDVIQTWGKGNHLIQGERFGAIRWGSQVDLIIPLKDVKYDMLIKKLDYVEAGLDPILRIVGDEKRIPVPMLDDHNIDDEFGTAFQEASKGG